MVKEELPRSLLENVDEQENETVRNAKQPNEAIQTIKRYKLLLKRENKKMIHMVGKQVELLNKI